MLHTAITSAVHPQAPAVVTSSGSTTWGQLAEATRRLVQQLAPLRRQRIGLLLPPTAEGVAALAALDELEAAAFLFDDQLPHDAVKDAAVQLKLAFVLRCAPTEDSAASWQWLPCDVRDAGPEPTTAAVTILTSGTEGQPKAARHTWQSLARPVRITDQPQRWLLTYRLHLYAGLQVMLQALLNHGTLAIAASGAAPDEVVELMLAAACRSRLGHPFLLATTGPVCRAAATAASASATDHARRRGD